MVMTGPPASGLGRHAVAADGGVAEGAERPHDPPPLEEAGEGLPARRHRADGVDDQRPAWLGHEPPPAPVVLEHVVLPGGVEAPLDESRLRVEPVARVVAELERADLAVRPDEPRPRGLLQDFDAAEPGEDLRISAGGGEDRPDRLGTGGDPDERDGSAGAGHRHALAGNRTDPVHDLAALEALALLLARPRLLGPDRGGKPGREDLEQQGDEDPGPHGVQASPGRVGSIRPSAQARPPGPSPRRARPTAVTKIASAPAASGEKKPTTSSS